jgi:hypothetical protein
MPEGNAAHIERYERERERERACTSPRESSKVPPRSEYLIRIIALSLNRSGNKVFEEPVEAITNEKLRMASANKKDQERESKFRELKPRHESVTLH